MNASEITTVEEAAEFFARMRDKFPGYKVVIRSEVRTSDGDTKTEFNEPVRAVLNMAAKRIEVEVDP